MLALAAMLAFGSIHGTPRTLAAQTWTVRVGDGGQGVSANGFFPGAMTVEQGSVIHFENPYQEIHTLAFVPPGQGSPDVLVPGPAGLPQVGINSAVAYPSSDFGPGTHHFDPSQFFNSGILNQGDTIDLSFDSPLGTHTFICLIHGGIDPTTHQAVGMKLDVTVVPHGTLGPVSADALVAQGDTQRDALINEGVQAENGFHLTSTKLPDASTNWGVNVGGYGDQFGLADISRFSPGTVNVNVGDTITWTNNTGTPHTVSFFSGLPDIPLFTPVPNSAGGPPFLAITPSVVLPSGGPTYDGTGYVNSGVISTGGPPTNTFSLKFSLPGTYHYLCQIHDNEGMLGTIVVTGASPAAAPSGAAPSAPSLPTTITPPNTGSGPPPARDAVGWLPALLLLGIAGFGLLLAGTRAVKAGK
jgi:plastocyanin